MCSLVQLATQGSVHGLRCKHALAHVSIGQAALDCFQCRRLVPQPGQASLIKKRRQRKCVLHIAQRIHSSLRQIWINDIQEYDQAQELSLPACLSLL